MSDSEYEIRGPAAVNLTFGNSIKTTVICSTGSSVTLMHVELYEKIKALPNAKEVILSDSKSEFSYQGDAFRSPKQKIIAAIRLKAVLVGVTVVINFHVVKNLVADGILGFDFLKSLPNCHVTAMYFEWNRGSKTIRAKFLEDPKFRDEEKEGEEYAIVCAVRPFSEKRSSSN